MNAIQTVGCTISISTTPSPALQRAMDEALRPHPDLGRYVAHPAAAAEALAILPTLERAAAPVSEAEIRRWFLPASKASLGNTPAIDSDYRAWVLLVLETSGDLPASVFSPESRGEVLRACKSFWPAPGLVDSVLRPRARDILRTLVGARRVAACGPPAPRDPGDERPATEEARDAIVSAFKAKIATVLPSFSARRDEPRGKAWTPAPVIVTPAQRLAQLE